MEGLANWASRRHPRSGRVRPPNILYGQGPGGLGNPGCPQTRCQRWVLPAALAFFQRAFAALEIAALAAELIFLFGFSAPLPFPALRC